MALHAAPEQQKIQPVPSEDIGHAQRVWADLVYEGRPAIEQPSQDALGRVQAFRGWVQSLPKEQKDRLEGYVRQFYDDSDRPVGRHGSHVDWLADSATPEEVLAWKERQDFELQAQQHDPEVQEKIASVRTWTAQKYGEYVDSGRLARVGLLPDPVAAIKGTQVNVGDVRITMLWDRLGYWSGNNQVFVAQGHTGTTEERTASLLREIQETLPHELLHAARLGEFLPIWAKEGMAEYTAEAFACGEADVLYPDYRHKTSHIYLAERRLLGTLQLFGAKEIDTSVMSRALSSSGYDSPEFQELDNHLYESWMKRGMFQRVSNRVSHLESEIAKDHPGWHPARIQARATRLVSEELIMQGAALGERLHELGKSAAGQHLTMSIARGVASVPAQRKPSHLS